ncbi:MAG: cyclic nucleotide-binding domain-containing protein [Acidobacteria bacterium]|nr:cyclic nucleotide-binding domain-containing protein [Acidobacteriota bacterium]
MTALLEDFDEVEGIELFQRLPIFRGLNFDETRRLAGIARTERFEEGAVIVEQDALGMALYLIKNGEVSVVKLDTDGGGPAQVLGRMTPGELFGEMTLVDDVLTSARVVAATDVEVFAIPRSDFDALLATDTALALKIYRAFCRTLSDKLRQLHARLMPHGTEAGGN